MSWIELAGRIEGTMTGFVVLRGGSELFSPLYKTFLHFNGVWSFTVTA